MTNEKISKIFSPLLSQKHQTEKAKEKVLLDLHRLFPSITRQTWGVSRTATPIEVDSSRLEKVPHWSLSEYKSSYERLLEGLTEKEKDFSSILDVACGDGPLLEVAISKLSALKNIVGVDMSEEELNLARSCLQDSRVKLMNCMAQKIELPDSSLQIITCHMAIFLFDPLEHVLLEVKRLLLPEGIFLFNLVASEYMDADLKSCLQIFHEILNREFPDFKGFQWGDARLNDLESLRDLIEIHFKDFHRDIYGVIVEGSNSIDTAEKFLNFFYFAQALSSQAKNEVVMKWSTFFSKNNISQLVFPLARVKTVKR